jgi:hypothetical protein
VVALAASVRFGLSAFADVKSFAAGFHQQEVQLNA